MIDFNSLFARTAPLVEAPSMQRIQYNNWLKKQAERAPVDDDWVSEQTNTMFMDGYRPNNAGMEGYRSNVPEMMATDRSSGIGISEVMPEQAADPMEQAPVENPQNDGSNFIILAIERELKGADDGSFEYAREVLRRLPSVFARYENADPSLAMPNFLSGQQGRQRETEMVRFNDFMR